MDAGLLSWSAAVTVCAVSVLFPQRERQAQREDALELTEKLDQDWKEIQTLLAHKTPKSENRDKKEKPKVGIRRWKQTLNLGLWTRPFSGEEAAQASTASAVFP